MAVADQPSGLMDIASSLTQDEIPFKLRCAICNKLAVNAFRLPCCDQAICESCQTSLPETCPVCAHTPISSDLCKPNKALRTTLKAFLRTEEKKREKERQAIQTAATTNDAPAAEASPAKPETQREIPVTSNAAEGQAVGDDTNEPKPTCVKSGEQVPGDQLPTADRAATSDINQETNPVPNEDQTAHSETIRNAQGTEHSGPIEHDEGGDTEPTQPEQGIIQNPGSGAMYQNPMGYGMDTGMFPNMAWTSNGDFSQMAQLMGNGMGNFPNPMGMSGMVMDPMAANQGIFGGYGMNMNGMSNGMNMGMNFNAGQGMYGGWDGSQNNMWNGGQDKFNPNAFANGMGAQYGGPSGFGGYNMSQPNGVHAQMQQQQFPNQDFQNGYYSPGYGRGNFRGRGRGFGPGGRGRGGFAGHHMQPNFPNANYPVLQNNNSPSLNQDVPSQSQEDAITGMSPRDSSAAAEGKNIDGGAPPLDEQEPGNNLSSGETVDKPDGGSANSISASAAPAGEVAKEEEQQLHGIPTIDSLDQVNNSHMVPTSSMGMPGHMGPGFGRGGYMRGPFQGGRGGNFNSSQFVPGNNIQLGPRGQGVEGAPAAPRAMREGLPNTSVFRHRNFQGSSRASIPPVKGSEASQSTLSNEQRPQSGSRSLSRARSKSKSGSKSRSPSPQPHSETHHQLREPSVSIENNAEGSERDRGRHKRPSHYDKSNEQEAIKEDNRRSRSPSLDSHRSSRHRARERDKRSGRRSHRSHRRRSRSPSKDAHGVDRMSAIPEENSIKSRGKDFESQEISSRDYQSKKDRPSRREEDKERDRDGRRREKERDRDRDRDRYRERERDRDRDRERHRDRDKDRERAKKRSRRDRSESAADSDYSSRHHSRRAKRGREDDVRTSNEKDRDRAREMKEKASSSSKPAGPEKDPHTLEREARNRERMLKEQQRREAMHADRDGGKSNRKRESRHERTSVGGRRLNYKYDDETDAARAARVEKEREASRWA